MNLHDAECLAISLMTQYGLDADGWKFGWNYRKRAYGLCSYVAKEISLSKHLTPGESVESIRHTILHEIAHAMCPGAKHGPVWKMKCRELGIDPTWKRAPQVKPKYNYVVVYNGEVIRGYYKFPKAMARNIKASYLPGRRAETLGKLELIKVAA